MRQPHVAVLGAGPAGLDAALALGEAGLRYTLYEVGPAAAHNVRRWGHVHLFTPWSMNASPRARQRLRRAGHIVPDSDECPTGEELVDGLLAPLAGLPEVAANLRTNVEVVEVGRQGVLKHEAGRDGRAFRLLLRGRGGREWVEEASAVLDCTGTYHNPNPVGADGIFAPGEEAAARHIVHDIPDIQGEPEKWAGRRILLVGGGHSAQTAARDLAALRRVDPTTEVTWVLRRVRPDFGVDMDDPLPRRRVLTATAEALMEGEGSGLRVLTGATVASMESGQVGGCAVTIALDAREAAIVVHVDRIIGLTGSVGDARLYRQLQIHECWATCSPMRLAEALRGASADCTKQRTPGAEALANPEPGFYILGAKSYGRHGSYLFRVGWEQVDEVVGLLAADSPVDRA